MTLAPQVRVNCVSPGWIDTGGHGPLKPGDHAQHPVGRVGVPDDVAAAVTYLLSEEAAFVTGAELIVDGTARTVDLSPFDPGRLVPLDPARLQARP